MTKPTGIEAENTISPVESRPRSETEDDFDYMRFVVGSCKALSMWPVETETLFQSIKHKFLVCSVILYCLSILVAYALRIALSNDNVDGIAKLIDLGTVFTSGTFRYIYMIVRGKKYARLVDVLRANFKYRPLFAAADDDSISLRDFYKTANFFIITFSSVIFLWTIQSSLQPIIMHVWPVRKNGRHHETESDLRLLLSFNLSSDNPNLRTSVLLYIHEIVGGSLFSTIYSIVDNFWYMVIILTIGQFHLLKVSYENLMNFDDDSNVADGKLKRRHYFELDKRLEKCMNHHNFLKEFVLLVDDLSNPNVIMDFLHATISLAFLLLEVTVSVKNRSWGAIFRSVHYLVISMGHMFMFDWLGNKLAEKEEELAEVMYDLPWYKFPWQKYKLISGILVSRRPRRLTVGKMFNLSLQFYTATMKAVFSYFTFLMQMRNESASET